MDKIKHGHQIKILLMLNKFCIKRKWSELNFGLKIFNKVITRYYISHYFKLVFQVTSLKFPNSVDRMPQFIDCLMSMNLKNKNEIVYSIVLLLFGQKLFLFGTNLLQMYHLTNNLEEPETSILISILNPNLDYIKWREAIENDTESTKYDNHLAKQIAENCSYQFQNLIETLDTADLQLKKLSDIYIYYGKINDLKDIFEKYSDLHLEYLNAQKYLLEFEIVHLNKLSIKSFQKIVKICQSDSYILKYCKYFNDHILMIDSYFDMLDYGQWRDIFIIGKRYNAKLWRALKNILLETERTQAIKDCIKENWNLRKNYWVPYHFDVFTDKYMAVDQYRISIGVILLGYENDFIKKLIQLNNQDTTNFEKEILVFKWLSSK